MEKPMEDIKEEFVEDFGGGFLIWPAKVIQADYKEWKEELESYILENHMTEDDFEEKLKECDRDFSGFPYWVTSSPKHDDPTGFESKEEARQYLREKLMEKLFEGIEGIDEKTLQTVGDAFAGYNPELNTYVISDGTEAGSWQCPATESELLNLKDEIKEYINDRLKEEFPEDFEKVEDGCEMSLQNPYHDLDALLFYLDVEQLEEDKYQSFERHWNGEDSEDSEEESRGIGR